MELSHIAVFCAAAIPFAFLPPRARGWLIFILSALAIYWLQPTLDIRWLDYSLPTATLVVTVICWWITRAPDQPPAPRQNTIALLVLIAVALVLTLPRYVDIPPELEITSRPPPVEQVGLVLVIVLIAGFGFGRLPRTVSIPLGLIGLAIALVVLKTDVLAAGAAGLLRAGSGQDVALAKALDLGWLGFSYVAFRLISTLRDRQSGILPALTLREYVTYVIFFPAYTAGPIDRPEKFTPQYRGIETINPRDPQRITVAVTRIVIGMIKKFAIADTLALISLSAVSADQAGSPLALWGMLYAYAFRIFFDFSGYTDIAIGIGVLFGITLPENFDRPYSKSNIAQFWQSWHATLSAWARSYVYSPLSRRLISGKKLSNDATILVCNLATMIVIGLWHGVTIPFFVWGVWHALGLTAHKLWSDRTRTWYRALQEQPEQARFWKWAGILLTFHFVLIGWVWFALPTAELAARVMGRLVGIGW